MKTIDRETTEVVRVAALAWGESKEKGTPYLALTVRVADGAFMGALAGAELYFTEKTYEQNERQLLALGWDGVKPFSKLTRDDLGKSCIARIEIQEFTVENPRTGEVSARRKPMVTSFQPLVRVASALASTDVDDVFRRFQAARGTAERSAPRSSGDADGFDGDDLPNETPFG